MQPFGKRGLAAGAAAVTLGFAALGGSLVTASTALANAPGGTACNPTDGKISGRGATYETNAEALWWSAYDTEICGNTPETPADVAGSNMGIFNYPSAVSSSNTGAGKGLIGANCRTDAYWGSSLPYTEAQLTALDGAPGNATGAGLTPCPTVSALVPPFPPDAATNTAFPSASDQTANLMSFPIAGSSVALRVNLTAAECGGTQPSIELSAAQVSGILGGSILNWDSSALTPNNPGLVSCNVPIVRVVREDTSGTTGILKQYLIDVDGTRATATCAPGTTWQSYDGTPNTPWPDSSGGAASSTCSAVVAPTTSGGPALLALLDTTAGGIGYADLSDAVNDAPSDIQVTVQNAAGTAYVAPGNGTGANCDLSSLSEPGNGASTAMVGLVANDNWGSDNATVNGTGQHDDASNIGTAYPICGLTYDLVYAGLHGAAGTGAVANLTADQRRTLYSYITFVLSSLRQSILPNNNYASLPLTWQPAILAGFQKNF